VPTTIPDVKPSGPPSRKIESGKEHGGLLNGNDAETLRTMTDVDVEDDEFSVFSFEADGLPGVFP